MVSDTRAAFDELEEPDGPYLGDLVGAPAAVLVVDLTSRQVVHVNGVAEQLAPGTTLPVDLDTWSDVAELRDTDGDELSETHHPLSRVARSEPVSGQAVSAARRSALGARREPLWVVALPMAGAPMLEDHALVVLIPLRHPQAATAIAAAVDASEAAGSSESAASEEAAGAVGLDLRDRALRATALSFTVADALDPVQPLIWVNPAFTSTTGYELDDVVGKNCRFLQGPDTDPAGPRRLRAAIEQGVSASVTLLNYRKDGTPFWNQVDLSPVRDVRGTIAHFVGIQTDVTTRVEADLEKRRVLLAEREARADAEAARSRLSFLIDAVNRLSGTLDVAGCAERLLGLVVPYLADWALLIHLDDRAEASLVEGRHRDPQHQGRIDEFARELPQAFRDGNLVDLLLRGEQIRIIDGLDEPVSMETRAGYLSDLSVTDRTRQLGGRQAMVVALSGRSEVVDLLVLVRTAGRSAFSEEDTVTALDLGRRAGLILENVGLYQSQARIADVLQRSLLPDLPKIGGVSSAARYLANESHAEVGGDFYELLNFHDAGIGIAVGDVTGHDILAAAAMGHLKGLLRASAYDHFASPSAVLEKVDHLVLGLGMPTVATALFACAAPHEEGWQLSWSCAGHPPLVVRRPDGTVEHMPTSGNDMLLGVDEIDRTEHDLVLPAGSTVVAYTDGLVERRGETLDDGLRRLVQAVADAPDDVELICDHVLERMAQDVRDDDIALLVVTLG